jgi:hypothetical protein
LNGSRMKEEAWATSDIGRPLGFSFENVVFAG